MREALSSHHLSTLLDARSRFPPPAAIATQARRVRATAFVIGSAPERTNASATPGWRCPLRSARSLLPRRAAATLARPPKAGTAVSTARPSRADAATAERRQQLGCAARIRNPQERPGSGRPAVHPPGLFLRVLAPPEPTPATASTADGRVRDPAIGNLDGAEHARNKRSNARQHHRRRIPAATKPPKTQPSPVATGPDVNPVRQRRQCGAIPAAPRRRRTGASARLRQAPTVRRRR